MKSILKPVRFGSLLFLGILCFSLQLLQANPWRAEGVDRLLELHEMTAEQRAFYVEVVKKFSPVVLQEFRVLEATFTDKDGSEQKFSILDPGDAPTRHDLLGTWDMTKNHTAFYQSGPNGEVVYPFTLKDLSEINDKGWVRVPALFDGVNIWETETHIYFQLGLYHVVDTATFTFLGQQVVKEHSQDGESVFIVLEKSENYDEKGSTDEKLAELIWLYSLADSHGTARAYSPDREMALEMNRRIYSHLSATQQRNYNLVFNTVDGSAKDHHESRSKDVFIYDENENPISMYVFSVAQSHAIFQGDPNTFRKQNTGIVYVCMGEYQEGDDLPYTYCSVVDAETGEIKMPAIEDRVVGFKFRFRSDVLAAGFPVTELQKAGPRIDLSKAYTGRAAHRDGLRFTAANGNTYEMRRDLPAQFVAGYKDPEGVKANLPEAWRARAAEPYRVAVPHTVDRWMRFEDKDTEELSDVYFFNPFILPADR